MKVNFNLFFEAGEVLRLESPSNVFDELVVPWYLHVIAICCDNAWLSRFPESVSAYLPESTLQANTENFEAIE